MAELSTRERLIIAGMDELREYGMSGFSLRRVASRCGVSCAAPYKHFDGKQELFTAMADYIHDKWDERFRECFTLSGAVEQSIADSGVAYVRFLCENPHFKSVLMIKETGLDTPLASRATGIGVPLARLFVIYGRKHNLTRDRLRERIFLVKTLIFGSTILMDAEDAIREDRLELLHEALIKALKQAENS